MGAGWASCCNQNSFVLFLNGCHIVTRNPKVPGSCAECDCSYMGGMLNMAFWQYYLLKYCCPGCVCVCVGGGGGGYSTLYRSMTAIMS